MSRSPELQALLRRVHDEGIEAVRVAWCDLHGSLRAKTLPSHIDPILAAACESGVSMVSTILMKDTADRTAFKVFDAAAESALPGLPGGAGNLLLRADPSSYVTLPWTPGTGWLRGDLLLPDGTPVEADPRRVLQRALLALRQRGWVLMCGLELEFHVWRIAGAAADASAATWPAEPPPLQLLHPGYLLLSEDYADQADEVLAIVRRTALGLRMPLRSLEIEFGPSQFEAVFDPVEALAAADQMVLFRSAVRQALRRAGYLASFVCKPPLPEAIASGWHLHHSLAGVGGGNAFAGEDGALSPTGQMWLAGLLAHAPALTALCAPTIPAYARFRGSVMAPMAARWGHDNRGAMLRVIAGDGSGSTRIENRLPEPMANPYLVLAAHVFAGLDGIHRQLDPGPATEAPYAAIDDAAALPASLAQALDALADDPVLQHGLGPAMALLYDTVKRQEIARHAAAPDPAQWERREYLGRF